METGKQRGHHSQPSKQASPQSAPPVVAQTEAPTQPPPSGGLKNALSGFLNIHVIAEIVVFCVIIGWFSMKNKNLMKHIEDLSERLEEQADVIEKHDMAIKKLSALISGRRTPSGTTPEPTTPSLKRTSPQAPQLPPQLPQLPQLHTMLMTMAAQAAPKHSKTTTLSSIEEVDERPLTEEEIDREISVELAELNNK